MIESALVITVSTRAAAGAYPDKSGPIIAAALDDLGFTVSGPLVVPDGDAVGAALRDAVAAGPTDHTPEQTRGVVEREVPQLAAAIARYGTDHGVPTAMLSRGVAGVADRTLIVNLPGSSGGARDGMAVLGPVLMHAVSQLRGGDH